jgi:flagellar L-ring protein precursor FlgH
MSPRTSARRHAGLVLLLGGLAGCTGLDHFQKPPDMTAPGMLHAIPPSAGATNADPVTVSQQQRSEELDAAAPGSLWQPRSRSFFRDNRARSVGDLLTVEVEVDNMVAFDNQTQLQRSNNQSVTAASLIGANSALAALGAGASGTIADIRGNIVSNGQGQIARAEKIKVQVAATVVRRLPSGNLEIAGSQEIRVNDELREIQIRGMIRPEDIQYNNRIGSDKVAEARIIYGGRGISSDVQRPPWGQQLWQRIAPF